MSTIKTNQLAHTANGAATYTLPQTDGSAGQVLKTDGSGNLSWTSSGKILQVVSTTKKDTFSHASETPALITGLTAAITPKFNTSKVLISIDLSASVGNTNYTVWFFLYKGGSEISGATGDAGAANQDRAFKAMRAYTTNDAENISGMYLDSPSTTSATTYQVYMSVESGQTGYINRMGADSNVSYNPRTVSSITLEEVAA